MVFIKELVKYNFNIITIIMIVFCINLYKTDEKIGQHFFLQIFAKRIIAIM